MDIHYVQYIPYGHTICTVPYVQRRSAMCKYGHPASVLRVIGSLFPGRLGWPYVLIPSYMVHTVPRGSYMNLCSLLAYPLPHCSNVRAWAASSPFEGRSGNAVRPEGRGCSVDRQSPDGSHDEPREGGDRGNRGVAPANCDSEREERESLLRRSICIWSRARAASEREGCM